MTTMRATSQTFDTDDQKWHAVVLRDRRGDGLFFYAVRTTGVFCRPSCFSRVPRRPNVQFFHTCDEAERAGFRACKKCTPRAARGRVPEAVAQACRMIEEAEQPPPLNELAGAAGLSPFYFHRLFKNVVGVTPKAYAAARRVQRFQDGLASGRSVTTAMYDAGFGSSSRCYESAAAHLGMTPSQYKNGGSGHLIRFAVAECYLGWVLVAATERGICVIEFGDTDAALLDELKARFPNAELRSDDADFRTWVRKVLAYIEAPVGGLDLPLDIQGTAFQRRVWQALQSIPAGTTATYAEIAEQIGQPSAQRAVAQACGANPVAVAIPCHRVLRTGGEVGGYRWGVKRKHAILEREVGAHVG